MTATPYITPAMLSRAPTGVPWSIVPFPKATLPEQVAEQTNICWRASSRVDAICNQPLRATVDVEEEVGPAYRITVDNNGVGAMQVSRWPVVQIIGGQVSPATSFPPSWRPIPASAMRPRAPMIGTYGTTAPSASGAGPAQIDIAPGYVTWGRGREGCRVQVGYINGWAHAGLLAFAAAGALTMRVDDVTGFTGASAFVYDGGSTEVVSVLSMVADTPLTVLGQSIPAGPGTLTLAAPLQFSHQAGIVVSSLPQDVSWAAVNLAAAQVLSSGATSVSVQSISGSLTTGGKGVKELRDEAKVLLKPYARTI